VRRERAEELRTAISRAGLLDKTRAIVDDSDHIIIPVTSEPPADMLAASSATMVEFDFPWRKQRRDPIDLVREALEMPETLTRLVPSKWERVGDVCVVRLDDALTPHERVIGRAYASVLGVKTVLREVGAIAGEFRRPATRAIFGHDTITTHIENGIRYRLDAAEIMFSSGNEEERIRMAETRCDGETVVDMFAGIGYFSLPLAIYQKPSKVVACEINPRAYSFLVENIALNG